MRLAHVLAAAAAATAPPRGFLLVATNLPVQLLQRDADADWRRDELGCVLRDICAQRTYPATVVVGDANEASTVERNRPCDRIQARSLPDLRRLNLAPRPRFFAVAGGVIFSLISVGTQTRFERQPDRSIETRPAPGALPGSPDASGL